jgi:hypothetical protein
MIHRIDDDQPPGSGPRTRAYRTMDQPIALPQDARVTPAAEDNACEWTDRRATAQALRAATARNSSRRRRFVDPTTCDRDYSEAEREFMQAMHEYKHSSGRMFPTWSEVLEVLRDLGYEKPEPSGNSSRPLTKRA